MLLWWLLVKNAKRPSKITPKWIKAIGCLYWQCFWGRSRLSQLLLRFLLCEFVEEVGEVAMDWDMSDNISIVVTCCSFFELTVSSGPAFNSDKCSSWYSNTNSLRMLSSASFTSWMLGNSACTVPSRINSRFCRFTMDSGWMWLSIRTDSCVAVCNSMRFIVLCDCVDWQSFFAFKMRVRIVLKIWSVSKEMNPHTQCEEGVLRG